MPKLFHGPVVTAHPEDLTWFLEESPEFRRGDDNLFGRGRRPVTPSMLHIAGDVNEIACLDCYPAQPMLRLDKRFSFAREQIEVFGVAMACSGTASPGCKVAFITQ